MKQTIRIAPISTRRHSTSAGTTLGVSLGASLVTSLGTSNGVSHGTSRGTARGKLPTHYLRYLLLGTLLLALTIQTLGQSQNPQDLFNAGNTLLTQEQFAEALTEYRSAEASGYVSGALFLNMGLAASSMDSLGLAKVYFSRAIIYPDVTLAAQEALSFVELELGRRGARLPELGWMSVLNTLYFDIVYRTWVIFGLILVNLGTAFVVLHWFRKSGQREFRLAGITAFVVGMVVIAGSVALDMRSEQFQRGTQIVRETQVLAGPTVDAQIVQTAFEGFQYIVNINESMAEPAWFSVRMSNGARGWVERSAILTY
jgi:hypothetical protein